MALYSFVRLNCQQNSIISLTNITILGIFGIRKKSVCDIWEAPSFKKGKLDINVKDRT